MSNLLLLMQVLGAVQGGSGPEVSMNTADHIRPRFNAGTAYARIRLNTNGDEDANSSATNPAFTSALRGVWLDAGASNEVWVERILNSGTLNNDDPGASRVALTTSPIYGVFRTTQGSHTADVTFDFYDAASGGNLLQTNQILIRATLDIL